MSEQVERPDIEGLRDTYNRYVTLVNIVYAKQFDVAAAYPEAKTALRTIKEAFPSLHDYILWLEAERDTAHRIVAAVEAFAATLPDEKPQAENVSAQGLISLIVDNELYRVRQRLERVIADARKGTK